MLDSPFSSESQFVTLYRDKLAAILHSQHNGNAYDLGLSAFILVCANAYFDRKILSELDNDLRKAFISVRERYFRLLAEGRILDDRHAEDLLVFLKIALVGLEQLRVTEHRQLGDWIVQFNHIRSFRPQRSAARSVASIDVPFNENVFHYGLDLCERESFWSGKLAGKNAYLLYNKYPFARLHALLIPEPDLNQRQYLTRENHAWAWEVMQTLAKGLPGFGMGFNSLGTFASVNHLHFQTFIQPGGLPVANPKWRHNGGDQEYALPCMVFTSSEASWNWLEKIYVKNTTSYNLIYLPGKVYCFERKRQSTYRHASWTSGFAFYELSGNIITSSREGFAQLTEAQIEKEFKKLKFSHPRNKPGILAH
jgi:diadenosine tetraphosphate (Ap4A) HIT family hydrolase